MPSVCRWAEGRGTASLYTIKLAHCPNKKTKMLNLWGTPN
jgi:hypothetical protein